MNRDWGGKLLFAKAVLPVLLAGSMAWGAEPVRVADGAALNEALRAVVRSPGEPVARAERRVFAHYMVCYQNPVAFYKQEIELAQRHGIDGFALNCGAWMEKDREYNNPAYPGYVYLGLRVVLPKAGWKKVGQPPGAP